MGPPPPDLCLHQMGHLTQADRPRRGQEGTPWGPRAQAVGKVRTPWGLAVLNLMDISSGVEAWGPQ